MEFVVRIFKKCSKKTSNLWSTATILVCQHLIRQKRVMFSKHTNIYIYIFSLGWNIVVPTLRLDSPKNKKRRRRNLRLKITFYICRLYAWHKVGLGCWTWSLQDYSCYFYNFWNSLGFRIGFYLFILKIWTDFSNQIKIIIW